MKCKRCDMGIFGAIGSSQLCDKCNSLNLGSAGSKVTEVKPVEKDKLRAVMEQIKREMPVYMEYMLLVAQVRRASYDALIGEKFTADQALELCKKVLL